jgi:hypothetical protein
VNVATVFVLAAVVSLLTFARDLAVHLKQRHVNLTADERASLREPVEIRGMVMDNTRDAMTLQSALLLDLRNELTRLREENNELRRKNVELERKERELYIQIGRIQAGHHGDGS